MQKSILFPLLFFSIQIIAPPSPAQPIRKTAKPTSWQEHAKADIASIEKVLQENHPATADDASSCVKEWLEKSEAELARKLPLVTDEASYRQLILWYVNGIGDGITEVDLAPTQHNSLELSDISIFYDYNSRVFRTNPPGHMLTGCLYSRGYYVTKINDEEPQTWIKKNILPFCYKPFPCKRSTYAEVSPYILAWFNNPFAEKPTSITLHSDGMTKQLYFNADGTPIPARPPTEAINLTWEPIKEEEITLKMMGLEEQRRISEEKKTRTSKRAFALSLKKKWTPVDESQEYKPNPYDLYIKIPSFDETNAEVASSLARVADQVTHYDNRGNNELTIVFDLRGNSGGNSLRGIELLKKLYSEEYCRRATSRNKSEYWWRVTPNNYSWVTTHPSDNDCAAENQHSAIKQALSRQYPKELREYPRDPEEGLKCPPANQWTPNYRAPVEVLPDPRFETNTTIIIDEECAGSTLDFIDALIACNQNNVKLIGEPTSPYNIYSHQIPITIKSATGNPFSLVYPIKMRKNGAREHNERISPHVSLPFYLIDQHPTNRQALYPFLAETGSLCGVSRTPKPAPVHDHGSDLIFLAPQTMQMTE